MQGESPLWQQVLIFTLGPPIMAVVWAAMSRGWANTVQGGKISETTRKRHRIEFWVILGIMYVGGFGMFVYAHFFVH